MGRENKSRGDSLSSTLWVLSLSVVIGVVALLLVNNASIFERFAKADVDSEMFSNNSVISVAEGEAVEISRLKQITSIFNGKHSETDIQNTIHQMANSVIIANEKWGEIKITQKKIEELIIEIEESDFSYKDTYLDILNRWKNGDFTRAMYDHNEVWHMLNGSVGEATGVDWDAVPDWAIK